MNGGADGARTVTFPTCRDVLSGGVYQFLQQICVETLIKIALQNVDMERHEERNQ
jgi:hypothetical protein